MQSGHAQLREGNQQEALCDSLQRQPRRVSGRGYGVDVRDVPERAEDRAADAENAETERRDLSGLEASGLPGRIGRGAEEAKGYGGCLCRRRSD